jgi:hypothetical protein
VLVDEGHVRRASCLSGRRRPRWTRRASAEKARAAFTV